MRIGESQVTPGLVCPWCDAAMDRSTPFSAGKVVPTHTPTPGDITVCVYCVQVCVYDKDLKLRRTTIVEDYQVLAMEEVQQLIKLIKRMDRSKWLGGQGGARSEGPKKT